MKLFSKICLGVFLVSVISFSAQLTFAQTKAASRSGLAPAKSAAGKIPKGLWLLSTTPIASADDIQLSGNLLYLAAMNTDPVYDVSDPYRPLNVFNIPHAYPEPSYGDRHIVNRVVGNRYYALDSSMFGWNLEVWDINNGNPILLATHGSHNNQYSYPPRDMDIKNNKIYWLGYSGTDNHPGTVLIILDATDLNNIQQIGFRGWGYPNERDDASGIVATDNNALAFVASTGVKTLNVSNPSNITQTAAIETQRLGNFKDDIQLVGNYVFTSRAAYGIMITSLGAPNFVSIIGTPYLTVTDPSPWPYNDAPDNISFQVVGNYLYAVTSIDRKFKVIDISDKVRPVIVASTVIPTTGHAQLKIKVDAARGLAFVTADEGKLFVYNLGIYVPQQ